LNEFYIAIGTNMTGMSGMFLDRFKVWDAITIVPKAFSVEFQNELVFLFLILSSIVALFVITFYVFFKYCIESQESRFSSVEYTKMIENETLVDSKIEP
jgi:flagellar biogenesis protein FliO